MKILQLIFDALVCVLFTSADPNLFGSRKRRKAKERLASEQKSLAADTQSEIDLLKTQNPFESAAAKSAMTASARNAKQLQKRYSNLLGGNTNPEAIIASQAATQEAVAGTAGDIATGAEANKLAEMAQLKGLKANQMGQAFSTQESSINERGSGWGTLFQGLQALGGVAEGGGSVI